MADQWDEIAQEIGHRVRVARLARGWSLEALAYRSGVSWSTVQRTEKGRAQSMTTVEALAKVLEVDLRDLLGMDKPA
jgi:ribosome-binding protein aMBF1 (putative translation factor)